MSVCAVLVSACVWTGPGLVLRFFPHSYSSVHHPERSDSPEPSGVSMKSDHSIDLPYNFREGEGSPEER